MSTGAWISEEVKERIVALYQQGLKYREIGERTGLPKNSVGRIINQQSGQRTRRAKDRTGNVESAIYIRRGAHRICQPGKRSEKVNGITSCCWNCEHFQECKLLVDDLKPVRCEVQ